MKSVIDSVIAVKAAGNSAEDSVEFDALPKAVPCLIRLFGASIPDGCVAFLEFGNDDGWQTIRGIATGTAEFQDLEITGDGSQKLRLRWINDNGETRHIVAWLNVLING